MQSIKESKTRQKRDYAKHKVDKGTLTNSLLKILSQAEHNFLLDWEISGEEYCREKYQPSYFRTLKRRILQKYQASESLVRKINRLNIE